VIAEDKDSISVRLRVKIQNVQSDKAMSKSLKSNVKIGMEDWKDEAE
jgi:hypothetical protein